jgi:hypothetical protein
MSVRGEVPATHSGLATAEPVWHCRRHAAIHVL